MSEADPGGEEFEPRVVQKASIGKQPPIHALTSWCLQSEEELQLLLDCLSRNVIFATMEEDKLREIAAAMARYEVHQNPNPSPNPSPNPKQQYRSNPNPNALHANLSNPNPNDLT